MQHKHFHIPIFIPELACPFRCIYCNQHLISGIKNIPNPDNIADIIEKYLHTIDSTNNIVEVGFFGGSFTGIPINQQIAFLKKVQPYIKAHKIHSIRLSTRPDYISETNLEMLKDYNVKTIELGAQSLDNEVLKSSKREHSVEDVEKASALIKSYGFDLGLQMMIGLPGDNIMKSIATAHKIIALKADNTRIYPTIVIKNTVLEKLYNDGQYQALTMEECINTLKILIPLFEDAQVNIIRIGLHPSEELQSGSYIAGPYHPSMRELAETEIWSDIIINIITKNTEQSHIRLSVSQKQYNYAIGYRAKNKKLLENHFKKVVFTVNNELNNKDFHVDFD